VVLLFPLALNPNVREAFSAIHVSQDGVTWVETKFRIGLENLDVVRFISDRHACQPGYNLPFLD